MESLRQVLLYNYTLEEIHNNLSNTFGINTYSKNKKNAILTLCATGKGSSVIAKNIILDLLKDNEALKNIEIIPIEYDNHLDTINNLKDSYHILACIGNLRPKIDLSYFSIHQIFTKGFDTQLKNFLLNKINPNLEDNKSESSDVYEKAVNILSKYVKFINPRICVNSIRKFIEKIDKYILKSDELLDIILHMGCMMDRCIRGHFAIFDNKDDFINIFSDTFDDVRYAISILEDDFDLKIPDDEVCFTIQVLNRNN